MVFKLNLRLRAEKERNKAPLQQISNDKSSSIIDSRFKEKIDNSPIPRNPKDDKEATHRYEMIIYWNLKYWPNHKFEYQRLEFKARPSIIEATKRAQDLANLLAKVARKHGDRNLPVEVLAIYRKGAFQDWNKEWGSVYKTDHSFITETLKQIRDDKQNKIKKVDAKKAKLIR